VSHMKSAFECMQFSAYTGSHTYPMRLFSPTSMRYGTSSSVAVKYLE
jgi:hypothetical protein